MKLNKSAVAEIFGRSNEEHDEKKHDAHQGLLSVCLSVCLPDEHDAIKANAAATGHTASNYLLRVGIGYPIKSILDYKRVEELIKINADLGRLGGLLSFGSLTMSELPNFGKTRSAQCFPKFRTRKM